MRGKVTEQTIMVTQQGTNFAITNRLLWEGLDVVILKTVTATGVHSVLYEVDIDPKYNFPKPTFVSVECVEIIDDNSPE